MKRVRDLLKDLPEITGISPEDTVYRAIEILAIRNFSALPVLSNGTIVGIFSERDYCRKIELEGKSAKEVLIKDVMTPKPLTVNPDYTLEQCMKLMIEKGFRHLPVIDESKLIGILSLKEAMKAVVEDKDSLIDQALEIGSQKHQKFILERTKALKRISHLSDQYLQPAIQRLQDIEKKTKGEIRSELQSVVHSVGEAIDSLKPVSRNYLNSDQLASKRVLLAENNPKDQVVAKLALGGLGVDLDIASSLREGRDLIENNNYDIICVNSELVDIAVQAKKRNKLVKTVFMTSDHIRDYIPSLRRHHFISNFVSRNENDRAFTTMSIATTVSKLISGDIFGLEKYLGWGVDVFENQIESSQQRVDLIDSMESRLKDWGIRRMVVQRCVSVAEELLMNAIYDAPIDGSGKSIYNHLDRTITVKLKPHEQGLFRYACDGNFVGISVEDPFGVCERDTILKYLESCYEGKPGELNLNKGGAGRGIFMLVESAHLAVFNVKEGKRTEVIALFDVDLSTSKIHRKSSFHYFQAP